MYLIKQLSPETADRLLDAIICGKDHLLIDELQAVTISQISITLSNLIITHPFLTEKAILNLDWLLELDVIFNDREVRKNILNYLHVLTDQVSKTFTIENKEEAIKLFDSQKIITIIENEISKYDDYRKTSNWNLFSIMTDLTSLEIEVGNFRITEKMRKSNILDSLENFLLKKEFQFEELAKKLIALLMNG